MANKKSTDLTKAYKYANVKLINYIQKTNFTSIEEMSAKIKEAVNITAVNLQKDTAKHIKEGVFEASKGKGSREKQSVAEKKATHILEALTYASTANSIYRYSYLELGKHLRGISDNVAESINETLRELAKTGDDTIPNAKKIIVEKFERDGVLTVEYANGHKTNAENYAKMVARTSRMESTNLSNIKDALQLGTDIVECIGNDNTCSVCAKYRGRWFSISGKHPDYPPLYKTALSKGYNVIHPNCRCEFIGVYLEFHSDEEINKQKELAKQPFKDDRTAAQKRGYDRWQATNRKLWSEKKEYEDMKAVFGEDFPYTTLGGFRRAKHAGSTNYQKVRSDFTAKKNLQKELERVKIKAENPLPRYKEAVIPMPKLAKYALDYGNAPDKAVAFERALGFTADDAEEIMSQIMENLPYYEAIERGDKGYGIQYQVLMMLHGKNGKYANVVTGWVDDKDTHEMRLTSVYVTEKKFKE